MIQFSGFGTKTQEEAGDSIYLSGILFIYVCLSLQIMVMYVFNIE